MKTHIKIVVTSSIGEGDDERSTVITREYVVFPMCGDVNWKMYGDEIKDMATKAEGALVIMDKLQQIVDGKA